MINGRPAILRSFALGIIARVSIKGDANPGHQIEEGNVGDMWEPKFPPMQTWDSICEEIFEALAGPLDFTEATEPKSVREEDDSDDYQEETP